MYFLKKNFNKLTLSTAILFSIPFSVRAQATLQGLIPAIGGLIAKTIPVVFASALLFFIWGLAKFILHAGNEKEIEKGKRIMIWGLIALFVMASVWGLVRFFQSAIGLPSILVL